MTRRLEMLYRRLEREEHKISALEYELGVKQERKRRIKIQIMTEKLSARRRGDDQKT